MALLAQTHILPFGPIKWPVACRLMAMPLRRCWRICVNAQGVCVCGGFVGGRGVKQRVGN